MGLLVWQAVVLGIVQGVTEWLPISSDGHLVLAQLFLRVDVPVFFDAVLHVATLVVVLVFFRSTVADVLRALVRIPRDRRAGASWKAIAWEDPDRRLASLILLGSVPTGIIGILLLPVIGGLYKSALAAGLGLLVTGTVLLLSRNADLHPGTRALTWKDALFLGTMQGAAILPGVSRSGLTIASALIRGVERNAAARFSFLLSAPAIVGATILQADPASLARASEDLGAYAAGAVAAAVVGYACLTLLVWIIRRSAFHHFAWYCLTLGALVVGASVAGVL